MITGSHTIQGKQKKLLESMDVFMQRIIITRSQFHTPDLQTAKISVPSAFQVRIVSSFSLTEARMLHVVPVGLLIIIIIVTTCMFLYFK
jgi:hypothetical protein